MKANKRILAGILGITGMLAVATAGYANDANGERDPSIYDQQPDCMNRGQVAQGQPAPCELPVPSSGRRPRAPLGSASTVAGAPGTPGTTPGAPGSATSAAGNSGTAGVSSGTGQGAERARAAR